MDSGAPLRRMGIPMGLRSHAPTLRSRPRPGGPRQSWGHPAGASRRGGGPRLRWSPFPVSSWATPRAAAVACSRCGAASASVLVAVSAAGVLAQLIFDRSLAADARCLRRRYNFASRSSCG
eukprot:4482417-Alexandrium_andersonii.AAC.1